MRHPAARMRNKPKAGAPSMWDTELPGYFTFRVPDLEATRRGFGHRVRRHSYRDILCSYSSLRDAPMFSSNGSFAMPILLRLMRAACTLSAA